MDKDIKVIALDLDGTLLNNNKDISNRNLNAILKCHENGKQVIIATARPPRSVKSLLPKVLLDICSFVYYNGALICDYELGFEKNITIPRHLTQQIIAFCYENDPHCTISLEVKDKWYSNKPINHSLVFNPLFSPQILTNKELVRLNANKILLTEMGNIENIEHYFKRELHIVVTDNRTLMQLMNKDVSKASGLLTLCHLYKVKQSELIVFGDDLNDIDMFKMAGYAVAMENAVSELKKLADEITDSNDNDGVAKVLESLGGY